jgi:ubiquinone/menaquinone biosynthesis C-methylase UbiE
VSTYENYDRISATYDDTRRALGMDVILALLDRGRVPRQQQLVLDAGCGTGNYAIELCSSVRQVVCADLSAGMLGRCRDKLARTGLRNGFLVRCDLGHLPFRPRVFDAILANQSLHHLDHPGTGFPNHRRFFERAARSLKPGGLVIVNTISHEQLRRGVWWADLIKPAIERMCGRFASLELLEEMMVEFGFRPGGRVVPRSGIMQPDAYLDHRSLRSASFRSGDSHFTLLTEGELAQTLAELDVLEASGAISGYIAEREEERKELGQSTFVFATREA